MKNGRNLVQVGPINNPLDWFTILHFVYVPWGRSARARLTSNDKGEVPRQRLSDLLQTTLIWWSVCTSGPNLRACKSWPPLWKSISGQQKHRALYFDLEHVLNMIRNCLFILFYFFFVPHVICSSRNILYWKINNITPPRRCGCDFKFNGQSNVM